MTTKIKKWGNSLAVRIPKKLSAVLNLKEGSPIEFEETDGKILLKPIGDKKKELAESFKRAAADLEMKKMAEEGLGDYARQLKALD